MGSTCVGAEDTLVGGTSEVVIEQNKYEYRIGLLCNNKVKNNGKETYKLFI